MPGLMDERGRVRVPEHRDHGAPVFRQADAAARGLAERPCVRQMQIDAVVRRAYLLFQGATAGPGVRTLGRGDAGTCTRILQAVSAVPS